MASTPCHHAPAGKLPAGPSSCMSENAGPSPESTRRSLGMCLVLLTASIWLAAAFINQALVKPGTANSVHPFLLTYLNTSFFTLYLPFLSIKAWIQARATQPSLDATGVPSTRARTYAAAVGHKPDHAPMQAAAWSLPFWFMAMLTYNTSLALTSVTSNTIISSTTSLFTFILSICFLGEAFSTRKFLSIFACIAGTALVTMSDSESEAGSSSSYFLGDALTLAASCIYAGYTCVLRSKLPGDEAEAQLAPFFGYLGLFNTVFLAPILLLLVYMGVISLSTVPGEVYLVIVLEGLLAYVLADYLWARAIVLLGPTMATLGMSIQIPMAAAIELVTGQASWIHSAQTVFMTLGGAALIIAAFFSLNLADESSGPSGPSPAGVETKTNPTRLRRASSGDAENDESQGLLSAAEHCFDKDMVADGAATAGEWSSKTEGKPTTAGSWAKSVLAKLGRSWSKQSSWPSGAQGTLAANHLAIPVKGR